MAERLEALKQAADATDQAAAGDLAAGPRHLADLQAAALQAAADSDVAMPGSIGRGTMTPLSDDLSLPQPAHPGPAASPVGSPAGPPPMSPLTPASPQPPCPTVEEIFPTATDHEAASDHEAAAQTESPAAAIADMLRQGSSSLFFNRDLGRS